jgi:gluconolactonase
MPAAVYYITPEGKTVVATTDIDRPNGLTMNRAENILYLASGGEHMRAFDINPDGSLKNGPRLRNVWVHGGECDRC